MSLLAGAFFAGLLLGGAARAGAVNLPTARVAAAGVGFGPAAARGDHAAGQPVHGVLAWEEVDELVRAGYTTLRGQAHHRRFHLARRAPHRAHGNDRRGRRAGPGFRARLPEPGKRRDGDDDPLPSGASRRRSPAAPSGTVAVPTGRPSPRGCTCTGSRPRGAGAATARSRSGADGIEATTRPDHPVLP